MPSHWDVVTTCMDIPLKMGVGLFIADPEPVAPLTIRQWLDLQRATGKTRYCATCASFKPRFLLWSDSGYGDCTIPDESVDVPESYRAENEGTHAQYGSTCTFWKPRPESVDEFLDWPSKFGQKIPDFEPEHTVTTEGAAVDALLVESWIEGK